MFGFEVPAREWAFARAYIGSAMGIAKQKTKQLGEWPASDAAQDLLVQYGSILQRIGGRRFLLDARDKYEELVKELHKEGRGPEAARWGAKMGDLTKRLGESGDAWWIWAVRTAAGDKVPLPAAVLPAVGPVDEIPDPKPTRWWFSRPSRPASVFTSKPDFLPTEMPKSPLAERVMANALVALSAQWAEDGRLRQALELEKASLRLLGGVLPPSYTSNPPTLPKAVTAASSTQPSQTATDPAAKRLHLLSLSHARALLQIHQAEVLFSLSLSLKHPFHSSSLDLLQAAARQAEYAISQLTAIPLTHPDFPESPLPAIPTPDAELDGVWSNSSVLKEPSRRLLRDARRTAAHAWALSAVLYERQGEWLKAYECAERGMEWVAAGRVLTDFSRSPEAATKGREGLVAEFAETFEVHQRTRMKMLQYTHGTVVDPTKDNVADKSGEAKGKAKAKEGK
ncbi:hypothetical protein DACRYDRAFT_25459 [Dacryopinax primogenitus]|uniref:Uncharacterized protein n=1 Tax=Dacryopinax primogenitus (strain DJM 731) TaxID=1858805 RepID=M5FN35_DACPD|nr:uncharacterized protein DACRYDRAFT_25459 [Dacryopinax primogenitus]EJT96755.1 hypothetical protein DACRYDRAFT_25459 [Dacryopinax primogenitus]